MNCSKCNKEMTAVNKDGHEITIWGTQIRVTWDYYCNNDPAIADLIRSNVGKYATDGSTEVKIDICYECWIDALLSRNVISSVITNIG